MIGFQLLVIETETGFLADKVSAYFSLNLHMMKDEPAKLSRQALRLYNDFGKEPNEFELSTDELNSIKQAKTNSKIHIGKPIYHDLACDGIIVIPKTKDKFLSWDAFKNLQKQQHDKKDN